MSNFSVGGVTPEPPAQSMVLGGGGGELALPLSSCVQPARHSMLLLVHFASLPFMQRPEHRALCKHCIASRTIRIIKNSDTVTSV